MLTYSNQRARSELGRTVVNNGVHSLYVDNQKMLKRFHGDTTTGSPELFANAMLR